MKRSPRVKNAIVRVKVQEKHKGKEFPKEEHNDGIMERTREKEGEVALSLSVG